MRAEPGFALLAVMLVLALLAVVVTDFAFSMRLEASMVRSYRDGVVAAHLAEAGVQQAIREVLSQAQITALDPTGQLIFYRSALGQTPPTALPPLPRVRVPLGPGEFSYRISDETARIDINTTPPGRLDRLLAALGLDKQQRDVINDSIQDWRDADEIHRLNGAESEDYYLRLPVPYRSRNGDLQDTAELLQIRGVTRELYFGTPGNPGLRDLVTVAGLSAVNLNTASAPVLEALGLSNAEIDEVLRTRVRAPYTAVPGRFAGRGFTAGATATFRIEAEGLVAGTARGHVVAIVQRGRQVGSTGVTILSWRPGTGE